MKRLITLLFLFTISLSYAQDPLIDSAKSSYDNGDYQSAIEQYQSILNKGLSSFELYYNLGNAYYRNGEIGLAILNYERSLKITPGDDDAIFNLSIANAKKKDVFAGIPDVGLGNFLSSVNNGVSFEIWSILSVIVLIGGALVFIVSKKNKNIQLTKVSLITGVIGLGLFGLALKQKSATLSDQSAIVLKDNSNIFSEPNSSSTLILEVNQGSKLQILSKENNWIQINTPNNEKGWIQENNIGEI